MTNNEMLRADMLDILFEHRNKAYGAYALRRNYEKRMQWALVIGLSGVLLVSLIVQWQAESGQAGIPEIRSEGLVIREINIQPPVKPREPDPPKQPAASKPRIKKPQVIFTSRIEIRRDDQVKQVAPSADMLAGRQPGDENIQGPPAVPTVVEPVSAGTGGTQTSAHEPEPDFVSRERSPEFPGGAGALSQFLARNLRSPEEMSSGEKILVLVRFKVDADGQVSHFEIEKSGGREFDSEVLRVVKKMPRWEPAFQNGIHVPVSYMIPITFVGRE